MAEGSEKTRRVSGGHFCAAISCISSQCKEDCRGKSFYRFPSDEKRGDVWLQNLRRDDLLNTETRPTYRQLYNNFRLCSDHFEDSQFTNADKKRLVWNAVPTLFNIPNPPPSVTGKRRAPRERFELPAKKPKPHDQAEQPVPGTSQQDAEPEFQDLSSQDNKLKKRVKYWQNKARRLKNKLTAPKLSMKKKRKQEREAKQQQAISVLSEFLSGPALKFFKTQVLFSSRSRRGYRWTEDKRLALSIYHASPKAYNLLKKVFALPSKSTLERVMRGIAVYPGFNHRILSALGKKVESLPDNSELCAIVFDEMTIKEAVVYNSERDEIEGFEDFGSSGRTHYVANHATVFMVRGLVTKWKQAVGYFLSSGPIDSNRLHTLLLDCIEKVEAVGLNVKIVIADQGSNNRRVFETLCEVSPNRPFFNHTGKQIRVMYDPPHLLKNIRNNLKNSGFLVGNKEVKWSHIEQFHKLDSEGQLRLAPKLTAKHIQLPPFASLQVKYAAQVLSHSVSAGILFLVDREMLPQGAEDTADFVEKMDKLFNAFNSGSLTADQQMRHAFQDSSGHREFLVGTLQWLQTLKSLSPRPLPCLSGWKMAINCLLSLWDDLSSKHGLKFLLTNRLNQDCVENLFSTIRGKGGHRDNPDAQQFRHALKAAMVASLIVHSKSSNCMEDTDTLMLTLTSMTGEELNERAEEADGQLDPEVEPVVDNNDSMELFWLMSNPLPPPADPMMASVTNNIICYIAGYIASKVKNRACEQCKPLLTGTSTGVGDQTFLRYKRYENTKGQGLITPSTALFEMTKVMETTYVRELQTIPYINKVKAKLTLKLKSEVGEQKLMCPRSEKPCQISEMIEHLFLNVRLNLTLRDSTRSFSERTAKTNKGFESHPFVALSECLLLAVYSYFFFPFYTDFGHFWS